MLSELQNSSTKLLAVTKYFDRAQTLKLQKVLQSELGDQLIGLGENRGEQLKAKNLNPPDVHFIGNLQSRQLPTVLEHASCIQSLYKPEHGQKLQTLLNTAFADRPPFKVFLQVNISYEEQKQGIAPEDFAETLQSFQTFDRLEIIGISALGAEDYRIVNKVKEYQHLRWLRDQYLPQGQISAGTSTDWEIAIGEGVDIIRVGQALKNIFPQAFSAL